MSYTAMGKAGPPARRRGGAMAPRPSGCQELPPALATIYQLHSDPTTVMAMWTGTGELARAYSRYIVSGCGGMMPSSLEKAAQLFLLRACMLQGIGAYLPDRVRARTLLEARMAAARDCLRRRLR